MRKKKVYDWMTEEDEWMKPYVDHHLKNARGMFGSDPGETTLLYRKSLFVFCVLQTDGLIVDEYGTTWLLAGYEENLLRVIGVDLQGNVIFGRYAPYKKTAVSDNGLPRVGLILLNNYEPKDYPQKNAIRWQCTSSAIAAALKPKNPINNEGVSPLSQTVKED